MNLPAAVTVREVGPRDGFQAESAWIPTEEKIRLIDELSQTGLRAIEATSFVSPRAIPQLRDGQEVMAAIQRRPGVEYSVLVPNAFGARRAVEARADLIGVVVSASETHNRENVNRSIAESLGGFREVMAVAQPAGIPVLGAIATAFGCPYEGEVPAERVVAIAREMVALGMEAVELGDTTGMANPRQVQGLLARLRDALPDTPIHLHFHDTRGVGLANVLAGLEAGATHFDASVGGLGGCPYAPGASGNIATEDLVYLLESMGVATGVDLERLMAVARHAQEVIGRPLPSSMLKAGPPRRLAASATGRAARGAAPV